MNDMRAISVRGAWMRRGAVVVELMFIIPLLSAIVILLFFFGWGLVNTQGVRIGDRYAVWHDVYVWRDDSMGRHRANNCSTEELNSRCLGRKASVTELEHYPGTMGTLDGFAQFSRTFDSTTGDMADEWLRLAPRGTVRSVEASFPTDVGLWQSINRPIRGTAGREGAEWRFKQTREEPTVINVFMSDMDSTMKAAGTLGVMVQDVYNNVWWIERPKW